MPTINESSMLSPPKFLSLFTPSSLSLHTMGPSGRDSSAIPEWVVNQDATARRMSLIGLIFSFLVVLSCITYHLLSPAIGLFNHPNDLYLPSNAKYLIPLAINGIITLSTECLGFIHSVSLRWALFSEGSLQYNANLRLFTFSRRSWPNGRICNIVYLLGLSMCYAATPAIIYENGEFEGHTSFAVSGAGFTFLESGLLIMCILSLWSFLNARDIPTWSSHPLNTTAAATALDPDFRRKECCMRSVHDEQDTIALKPKSSQGSAYDSHRQVAFVLWAEHFVFACFIIWTSIAFAISKKSENDWSFIPTQYVTQRSGWSYGAPHISIKFLVSSEDRWNVDPMWVQVPFLILIQSIVTIGMHCAELLVTISRDEAAWRAVCTENGSTNSRTSMFLALFNWETLTLTLLKPFIHWVFGLAVVMTEDGVFMMCPQLVYFTSTWAVLLIFLGYITFRKPRGPLPATYGHLQTLTNLVDEWHEAMFWGHKSEAENGVCHAGTSDKPLPEVRMDAFYKGAA